MRFLNVYLAAMFLAFLALLVTQPIFEVVGRFPLLFAVLVLCSFFAQIYEISLAPGYTVSTQIAISLSSIYIGGLPLALFVITVSTVIAEIILRWDLLRSNLLRGTTVIGFNVSQLAVSVAAAAALMSVLEAGEYFGGNTYALMAASFIAYMAANHVLVGTVVALSGERSFRHSIRLGFRHLPLQFLTLGILAMLLAELYAIEQFAFYLLLIPVALVHYSVRSYVRLRNDSRNAFKKIMEVLALRDRYTGEHSEDVEGLAEKLALALHLDEEQVETVRSGAAIHDIGKVAIPDSILNKEGGLDHEEFETMKTHTRIGAEIVGNLGIYRHVVPIVLHEHEHWDGQGYPEGIAGESIPLGARIVAVADVYSALTTERRYRPALGRPLKYSREEACDIMKRMAGSVLDPTLVSVFVDRVVPKEPAQ